MMLDVVKILELVILASQLSGSVCEASSHLQGHRVLNQESINLFCNLRFQSIQRLSHVGSFILIHYSYLIKEMRHQTLAA